ncbi:class I adenylate-forming enzyme family protein, partial [Deinococcus pimensis]|uniref:class I adenylate-forming enzyme family protein n=1 Tax=Deinococcus pimensis TaxID=309888 RepID=UPI00146F9CF2
VSVLVRHPPSLYALAAWTAARFPHAPALVEDGRVTTYADLRVLADRAASRLAVSGPRGVTVGLLADSSTGFVVTLLGAARAGVPLVLLDPSAPPQRTQSTLREQKVRVIVTDDERASEVASTTGLRTLALSALTSDGARTPALGRRPAGRLVLLTSGTTGEPRAVRRAANARLALRTLPGLVDGLELRAFAPTALTLPLFHGHGLATLAASLALGAPLHLLHRAPPRQVWNTLEQAGIEVLVVVPTVLYRLLTHEGGHAPALRTIVCGSAPLGEDLARRALARFGPVLCNLYGASEWGLATLATPRVLLADPGSVGRTLPGIRLRVRLPDGTAAAPGEVGEVHVRAGRREVATGDLGRLSSSGVLTLCGRRDDLLIVGGEKVLPEDVEARVSGLPYVRECAVRAVPSEEYGQALAAFVVVGAGWEGVTAARVSADLKALLPRRLRPVHVEVVDELPRNTVGKLVRRRLPQV